MTEYKPKRFAAIDLGSNTCRLLIAETYPDKKGYEIIHIFSRIVRLAESIHKSGTLSDDAQQRAISVLHECVDKVNQYDVEMLRAVTTEASRKASNANKFIQKVKQETGINLEIISEKEEARLSLMGCAPLLKKEVNDAIIFDVGGASTEVIYASKNGKNHFSLVDMVSIPNGVVTLSETYGSYMPLVFNDIIDSFSQKCREFLIKNDIYQNQKAKKMQILGCSGTATTIAAMSLGLEVYDRSKVDGYTLSMLEVHKVRDDLRSFFTGNLVTQTSVGYGREDLITVGVAIIIGILNELNVPYITVADRGVRDGILHDIYKKNYKKHKKIKRSSN